MHSLKGIELFPINYDKKLYFYKLNLGQNSVDNDIGSSIAYRLRYALGSWAWVREQKLLISSSVVDATIMASFVKEMWSLKKEFCNINSIELINEIPTGISIATFVCDTVLDNFNYKLSKLLNPKPYILKADFPIEILKRVIFQPYEFNLRPHISISIKSDFISSESLDNYLAQHSEDDCIGMNVVDINRTHKRPIIQILPEPLAFHRLRLKGYKPKESILKLIDNSNDNVKVIKIGNEKDKLKYDYPATALYPIIDFQNMSFYHANAAIAKKMVCFSHKERATYIKTIKDYLNCNCNNLLDDAINSKKYANNFPSLNKLSFSENVIVGSQYIATMSNKGKTIFNSLKLHGMYKTKNESIKIGVITVNNNKIWKIYEPKLLNCLNSLKCNAVITETIEITEANRHSINKSIDLFIGKVDIVIFALPQDIYNEDNDELNSPYSCFKQATISRNIAGQAVNINTLSQIYKIENLVLDIVSKTGSVPWALPNPLPYCDYIIGLDIGRSNKVSLQGSSSIVASTSLYASNGCLEQYNCINMPIEGETIPKSILQILLPSSFSGKKIIIHRDGMFRGNEKRDMIEWGKQINAIIYFVEIIKSGSPRFWNYNVYEDKSFENTFTQPEKGTCFILNSKEAFLISSLPPYQDSISQPLHIISDGNLSIENAVNSILMFSLCHIGSKICPRLPVTIHFADALAGLAIKGIVPGNQQGNIPYWL